MNKKYLKIAYEYAEKHSTDPSTQNGAILVNNKGKIVAKGANHFPEKVKETKKRWQRPQKYFYVTHAERTVIHNAAKKGIKTKGLTLYCPWAACSDCARAIIESGIKKVVVHKKIMDKTPKRWEASTKASIEMFKETGVIYEVWDGEIGNIKIKFNSKPFTP